MPVNQFLARNAVSCPGNGFQSLRPDFLPAVETLTIGAVVDSAKRGINHVEEALCLRLLDYRDFRVCFSSAVWRLSDASAVHRHDR